MATDTITNFIVSVTTLMDWVKDTLSTGTSSYWSTTRVYEGQGWELLYHFLPEVQPPSCVIIYTGSVYAKKPRATHSFSVLIVDRNFRYKETAQGAVFDKAVHAISLLDHEMYDSHAICYATKITWIDLSGKRTDGLTAYKIDFIIEDH